MRTLSRKQRALSYPLIYLGFLWFHVLAAEAQTEPLIRAPQVSVTVPPGAENGHIVRVEGWSCGADQLEDVVGVLAELSRRQRLLTDQRIAGEAMLANPALVLETDRNRKIALFETAITAVAAQATPEIRDLTDERLADLANGADPLSDLREHDGAPVRFRTSGITDAGTTRIHRLADCMQTVAADRLRTQVRQQARAVLDAAIALRGVRNRLTAAAGS